MRKVISLFLFMLVLVTACGAGGNPNKPENPRTEKGGPWGCYYADTELVVARFKTFDLAMAGCVEEKETTGGEYYVQGPDKVKHAVEVIPQDLLIVTNALPSGAVGDTYPATTLEATGGTGPYDWEIASGSLPPGLVLTVDGTVQGTPLTDVGSPFQVRIAATDINGVVATETYDIVILPIGPRITTDTLPSTSEGQSYSFQLEAEDGVAPLSFRRTAGELPPGLILQTDGRISGTVGLVDAATTYSFTVTVTDAENRSSDQALSITVNAEADLSVTTTTMPIGDAGVSYSTQLTSAGGVSTVTWSLTAGSLPTGITLSNSGLISGITNDAGSYSFTVQAQDSIGQTATGSFVIDIRAAAPVITTDTLPNATINTAYSASISWAQGTGPYSVTIAAGSLPTGLTLNSGTGAITGTPTATGTFSFTAMVTDANNKTGQKQFSISVDAAPLSVATDSLPGSRVNEAYSATVSATGGIEPYTWTVFGGSLPPELSLSPDGTISGTATVEDSFMFSLQVASSDGQTDVKSFTIVVDAMALGANVPGVLPAGKINEPYTYQLNAQGGSTPYTWAIIDGALPPGLSLNSTGEITGTPTSNDQAQYVFTVEVTDSLGAKDSVTSAMVIEDSDAVAPSATLRWEPPTEREDGTPLALEELGGYRLFARPQGATEWTVTGEINNPNTNWYEFYNLSAGVWEFAATAFDVGSLESELSVIVSKEITVE